MMIPDAVGGTTRRAWRSLKAWRKQHQFGLSMILGVSMTGVFAYYAVTRTGAYVPALNVAMVAWISACVGKLIEERYQIGYWSRELEQSMKDYARACNTIERMLARIGELERGQR